MKKFMNPQTAITLCLALFLVSGCASKNVQAASGNYYVSQLDSQADDNNPGTEQKPFKSINGCLRELEGELKSGDTIWIKDGLYREQIRVSRKQRKGFIKVPSGRAYLTLQGFPGQKPVIKGSKLVTGWTKHDKNIWVKNDWLHDSQQVFVDGKVLDQVANKANKKVFGYDFLENKYKGKGLEGMEPGTFHYAQESKKLYVWLQDNANPNDKELEVTVLESDYAIPHCIEIRSNFFRLADLTLQHGGVILAGDFNIIDNIDQSWAEFVGGFIQGSYNNVLNSSFNYNGNTGMGGNGSGHRVIDCTTNYNNYRNYRNTWHSGGTKFIGNGCREWVVKGHTAAYNNGSGIWFDSWLSNVTIEGCRSYRNMRTGIHYELGSRGVIKNNLCYENADRGILVECSSYTLVTNNICYANGLAGIACYAAKRPETPIFNRGSDETIPGSHNLVTGNILVDNSDAIGLLKKLPKWNFAKLGEGIKYLYSKRLETYSKWGNRPELVMPDPKMDSNLACHSDYNIFHRSENREKRFQKLYFYHNWNNHASSLEEWQKKTGCDKNSIVADPLFVDAENYNFRPKPNSPALFFCKKVDMALMPATKDLDKKPRPGRYVPVTAGAYGGDPEILKKMYKKPTSGKYDFFSLPKEKFSKSIWPGNDRFLSQLNKKAGKKSVSTARQGYKFDGVAFLNDKESVALVMAGDSNKATIKQTSKVKNLYFLIATQDGDEKAFTRCTIKRNDGFKIVIEWKLDANGDLTTTSSEGLSTKKVWMGKRPYKGQTNKDKVFVTTWKNDNEWLPVAELDFKLLNPKSKFQLIGLTGEKLK